MRPVNKNALIKTERFAGSFRKHSLLECMPVTPKRLVFIVDDNIDYHNMFRSAFKEVGPQTQTAFFFSGQALLDHLNNPVNPLPDLILLDLLMPGMNGLETLSHIRQTPRLIKIPTIILTASQLESDVMQGYHAGANTLISKPTSFDELKHFIDVTCRYWLEIAQTPTNRRNTN